VHFLCTPSPGFNPCIYQVRNWFQILLFQMQLVPLHYGTVVDVYAPGSKIRSAWMTSDKAYRVSSGGALHVESS
jgi:hypothetical protein